MRKVTSEELRPNEEVLLFAAEQAMKNAYAPYSEYQVGAALMNMFGTIVLGANYENAAYGSTICAERTAIVAANAQGIRDFGNLAIISSGEDPAVPCGACRQVIYEAHQINKNSLEIIMSNAKKDNIIIASIEELLPKAFGPMDLCVDLSQYRK